MSEYFAKPEHQEAALRAVDTWVGTKYEHLGGTKRGVDCVHFVGCLLVEIGLLDRLDSLDYYTHDWYAARNDLMCATIERHLDGFLKPGITGRQVSDLPKFGDLVCLRIASPVVNHTVFMLSASRFAHAVPKAGVIKDDLIRWRPSVVKVYRFFEGE